MSYFVGVDLGKQADYTGLSVVECVRTAAGKPEAHVVWLKRFRSVAYPLVIDEVAAMAQWGALRTAAFAVDASGVGRPIVDALRDRVPDLNAITITGGEAVNNPAPREWTVPKADLIACIQLLLQSKRLRIHDHLTELEALKSELLSFGYTINDAGRTRMEATSGHDDLVLSVAMACWLATRSAANGADAWIDFLDRASRHNPTPAPRVLTRVSARDEAWRAQRGQWV